jgi:hypothetical protein
MSRECNYNQGTLSSLMVVPNRGVSPRENLVGSNDPH